jgi:dihydrolipoamide dehydrogenase-binding protein of pyruvate dehydrogenase complex
LQGVPINTVVGLLVEASDEKPDMSLADAALPAAAPAAETLESSAAATPAATLAAASGSVKPLSPAVLALVNLYALDPAAIPASGPKGHILKGDVLAFIGDAPPPTVQPSSPLPTAGGAAAAVTGTAGAQSAKEVQEPQFIDIPVTTMRRVIAQRLTESKTTIPHSYTQMDVDVTELLALRTQMLEEQGLKFSVNDVIVKASALALRTVPIVNSHFLNDEIVPLTSVDISIAVATESGLITPIIPDADGRSVFSISSTIRVRCAPCRCGSAVDASLLWDIPPRCADRHPTPVCF